MKSDAAEFGFDSAATVSRIHCRISPYGPQHQPYTPHITPLGPDGFQPYRHNSISAYQPIKYYGISSYGDFADENVEYGMHSSNYSIMNQEPISIPYTSVESTRGWNQPQLPKSNSLFVEHDTSYNHGHLPSYSNAFPYRPNISPESKSLSLNGMSIALPAPVNGADRVLPAPASYRAAPVAGSYLRSSESPLPMAQSPIHFNNNSLMSINLINAVKALNSGAASENASMPSAYLPLSSSPPESVPSSHMSFGTDSVSSSQQNHDGYTHSLVHSQQSLFHHSNSSSGDIGSYGSSSSSANRPSISSQNGEDSQQPPSTNSGGSLVNGYCYIPPASTQGSCPAPSMVTTNMQPAPVISRQPVSAT
jgi:hypothetical protein